MAGHSSLAYIYIYYMLQMHMHVNNIPWNYETNLIKQILCQNMPCLSHKSREQKCISVYCKYIYIRVPFYNYRSYIHQCQMPKSTDTLAQHKYVSMLFLTFLNPWLSHLIPWGICQKTGHLHHTLLKSSSAPGRACTLHVVKLQCSPINWKNDGKSLSWKCFL